MITESMIRRGYDAGVVRLIDSPNDQEPACQIGDYWFYYAGAEGAGVKTSDYLTWTGMDDVFSEICDALCDLGEDEKKYYEAILNEAGIMDERKPFVVDIQEHFHRGVIIYAESAEEAEDLASSLCDCGEIDIERNCYAGRDTSSYPASENDLEIYDVYGKEGTGR